MAKKGRIQRNDRIKSEVNSQQEKRAKLKNQRHAIFVDYSKKIAEAKTEDQKQELVRKATMEFFQISVVFQKLSRDGSSTRIRNRCAITGRPRGYQSLFGLSRNVIRESASFGLIMGLQKSSW